MKLKLRSVAILLMFLPTQAAAWTSLCIEDNSRGFNWVEGQWTPVNFTPRQHIIQKIDRSDERSERCYSNLEQFPRNLTETSSMHCFSIHQVGNSPDQYTIWPCRENTWSDAQVYSVICNEGFSSVRLQPTGEFVMSTIISVPEYRVGDVSQLKRDSLSISVGKCSEIAR